MELHQMLTRELHASMIEGSTHEGHVLRVLAGNMTLREFRQSVVAITRETFDEPCTDALELGIRRAEFKQRQLKQLIAMGQRARFNTARRQVAAWRRELLRIEAQRKRFTNAKAGIYPNANPRRRATASKRRAALLVTAGIEPQYVSQA